jgi:hypothetical protein
MSRFLALCLVVSFGCAKGGALETTDGSVRLDSHNEQFDAEIHHDGGIVPHDSSTVEPDAFVPDASEGGQFCSVNSDCPDQGTCCFVAVCVPGTAVGNDICIPN